MEKTILSISGKPGLYLLLSRGRQAVIVESIDAAKKRHTVGLRDRITSLNDISVYTDEGDVSLTSVFQSIYDQFDQKPLDLNTKAMKKEQLADFMAKVLPHYDRDRVYPGDIKKIISWYNILVSNGYTEFETSKDQQQDSSQPEADTQEPQG